jgi:hypothetical protein
MHADMPLNYQIYALLIATLKFANRKHIFLFHFKSMSLKMLCRFS